MCVISLSLLPCAHFSVCFLGIPRPLRLSGSCTLFLLAFLLCFSRCPFSSLSSLPVSPLIRVLSFSVQIPTPTHMYSPPCAVLLPTLLPHHVASCNEYSCSPLSHYRPMSNHVSYIAHLAQTLMETGEERMRAKQRRHNNFYQ